MNSPKYVRYASDLHLEAFSNDSAVLAEKFIERDDRDSESILVLAGDISSHPPQLVEFITHLRCRFYAVQYVPGNHEYYRHDYDTWNEEMNIKLNNIEGVTAATDGVTLDEYYDEAGNDLVRFISCTLWGDGGKSQFERAMVGHYLNDFRLIGFKGQQDEQRNFRVSDMMDIHSVHLLGIEGFLKQKFKGKTIVVTHHLPSYSLCHPRFGGDANGGFASDSEHLIVMHTPDVWIHGHTHDTIDTKIGETRILCNPRGYRGEWDTQFNTYDAKFIEL